MKNKAPIFTYIITVFNAFIPSTIMGLLAISFVMTSGEGQKMQLLGFCFPSMIFSFIFCIASSLTYFYLIRRERFKPRWWSNLLLIIPSYLVPSTHAFLYISAVGLDSTVYNENAVFIPLFFEAVILTIIGFLWIGTRTRKPIIHKPKNKKKKRKYLPWILFPLFYYGALFGSSILMVVLIRMNFYITGSLVRLANMLICLPFYSDATRDFVHIHFSGRKGHFIFLANALIWGIVTWSINRLLNRNPCPSSDESLQHQE